MRGLIYLFIVIIGIGAGATAYFALQFTPIEAGLVGGIVLAICLAFFEANLRRRAEKRLEKSINDLAEMVGRDATTLVALTDRVKGIEGAGLADRANVLEADVSVLGTVVRQLAEAVSEIEDQAATQSKQGGQASARPVEEDDALPGATLPDEAVIPVELVRQALDEGRLSLHLQPIVSLPQRRTQGYDVVPRLLMEDGEMADAVDFMPRDGGMLATRIEREVLAAAVKIVRRARAAKEPTTLFVPVGPATLADPAARDELMAMLDANTAFTPSIVFDLAEDLVRKPGPEMRDIFDTLVDKGIQLGVTGTRSLRLDFAELSGTGFRFVKIDAAKFIDAPESLSDFHSADVAPFLKRSGLSMIATGVTSEAQILALLDDAVPMAQGPHIAMPAPVRSDLVEDRGQGETRTVRQVGA